MMSAVGTGHLLQSVKGVLLANRLFRAEWKRFKKSLVTFNGHVLSIRSEIFSSVIVLGIFCCTTKKS